MVRSRLGAVNETLEKIRDESSDRKVIGEAVGLLANKMNFEFAVGVVFFAKVLSPLDTLTTAIQGPDSTLHTVVSVSQAAVQCLRELRANLDEVFTSAVQLANENGTENQFPIRRRRKVSRRLDAAGSTETVTSVKDEVKHEMAEVVDTALSELDDRFGSNAGQLYEIVGKLMDKDTRPEELRVLVETLYPDFVDVDEVASQFEVVRHISAWNKAENCRSVHELVHAV